ncbi:ABC transporter substrate-binding protein [Poseidonocella sp. HB161398]|uniref:ABC transporter substrate-binding protein n=1 Tax=Poseidonocella sp. HB161398 TaxID=2320855 RepID=UPI001486E0BD|nr:ABC transporter substrate-binding protein [Poseidonocella sp. HB161398]
MNSLRLTKAATFAGLGLTLAAALPALAQDIPAQEAVPELHEMLPASVKEKGKIDLATDANYPPCQSFDEDGTTMVGFEVDLWNAMAQVLGTDIAPVSIDFGGLIPGVEGGRYDMAMECITDRVEREEVVTFVNTSLDYGNAFYFLADNEAITEGDPASLCGLTSAGQTGTDFVSKLEQLSAWCEEQDLEPLEIGQYPQQSAVLLALFAGRIDFTLSAASAVEEIRANNPVEVATIANPLEKQNYLGAIVAHENTELAEALLASLKVLDENGTYDAIFEKWDIPHAALDEFGINMTTTNPRD